MNLTNEQIQAILDGAPKGTQGYNIEESLEGYSYYFVSILDLNLLREILTLRQEVERLKAQLSEIQEAWDECLGLPDTSRDREALDEAINKGQGND